MPCLRLLNARNHPLPLLRLSPVDDATLWWQVLANCRKTLTLLRPRLDDTGAPWLPSPYWNAVLECVPELAQNVETPAILNAAPIEQCCSQSELLIALANARATEVPASLTPIWESVQFAANVARQRLSRQAPGIHEGIVQSADLLAELQNRFGPNRTWSVSRLNTYGKCPALFFGECVLKLEPRPDPDEGLDSRQRGSLMHAVMEELYAVLKSEGLAPRPEHREAILAHLDERAGKIYATAPARYGFRPDALWGYEQAEILRMLRSAGRLGM